jgi:hypothetical protein
MAIAYCCKRRYIPQIIGTTVKPHKISQRYIKVCSKKVIVFVVRVIVIRQNRTTGGPWKTFRGNEDLYKEWGKLEMGSRGSSIYLYENNSKTELGDMRCEVGKWVPMA